MTTPSPMSSFPSRRAFLRGAGVLLALPAMESLGVRGMIASAATSGAAPSTAPAAPVRLAFLYVPNGVNLAKWTVTGDGRDYELSPTLAPLAPYRNAFSILTGLRHDKAYGNGDGAGDHARAAATYLTGCQARKTGGADIRNGVSVDQIAAAQVGRHTRLPSLELSTEGERSAGTCDSGYSCAYQYNLSWKTETMPLPPLRDPRVVLERLFGLGGDTPARRKLGRSMLDFVLDDAGTLRGELGTADRRKLDQYLESVRDVERRIESAQDAAAKGQPAAGTDLQREVQAGVPAAYSDHIRLMFDLLVLAFQTDSTRVATFMLAHEGSNRSFPDIGVPEAHHQLSHHKNNAEKLDKIAKIDHFYTEQFAYLLKRLSETKDANGSLLDQSMIVYGSGISDGNQHLHTDLPILLAGRGGGTLAPGRCNRLPHGTPMTNLYLSLLQRMGVQARHVGDSTGAIESL